MIKISDLSKSYGTTTVLDRISLAVGTARIGAVVGRSGAGKSTLARCVNLLERPSGGSVEVNGQNLVRLSGRDLRSARRQIGTVFQSANLLRRLNAAQNVALPMRHAGVPEAQVRSRVVELLDRVGMLDRANHYPSQLSGGQRQRVGIARGLALQPSVLLADEATSGLDPDTTRAILALLDELRGDLGVTVLVITHEMDVVRAVADVVFRLDGGRIVESGSVADIALGGDSALSRALLPLPPALDGGRLRTWQVRYGGPVSPEWLARAGAELGAPVALLAALVEEVGGAPVGRLTLGFDPALDPRRIATVLARHGLVVETRDAGAVTGDEVRRAEVVA